jgi:1,2-dihydroxy-3-keto-5-methylthiopentene dioxygenase
VWKLDPETRKTDPKLAAIRRVRGYSYHDEITVAPGKIPDYEAKIRAFYREHIHPDEEIRFCLEGGGYFDIRDAEERWIRMRMLPGDFFVLPEGCYHRFCCDERNYTAMMRLFKGEPIWSSINRPCDEHESRRRYVEHFIR